MPTPPPPKPLCPGTSSMVSDPDLGTTVERDFSTTPGSKPTEGPNRLTFRVPTEKTTLSLGAASTDRVTDRGITAYTDSHIHFEVLTNHRTVMSLGTSATAATAVAWDGSAPKTFDGYAVVTEKDVWHESGGQHYLLSQTEDISLRAAAAEKRAVVQSDKGGVDVNAQVGANITAGGIAIIAGELELEKTPYGGSWEGKRADSGVSIRAPLAAALTGAISSLADIVYSVPRLRYAPGAFAPSAPSIWDKTKRQQTVALAVLATAKVVSAAMPKVAAPGCVTIGAPEQVGVAAGKDISIWGALSAGLGSVGWTTVSAAVSASLKAIGLASVAGLYTSVKGYKKIEVGSDLGMVFVGAEKKIEMEAGVDLTVAPGMAAHIASTEGEVHVGAEEKVWLGASAGTGFGLLVKEDGIDFGKADMSKDDVDAIHVNKNHAVHIEGTKIEVFRKDRNSALELEAGSVKVYAKQKAINITASSGSCTLNGSKVLLN